MGQILKDIYSEAEIAPSLGFKGGTCAYFFYGLPRFSVDLDFDLLSSDQGTVFDKVGLIIKKYGKIKDSHKKHCTLFFLLSYGEADRNIKIEISTRQPLREIGQCYQLKEYLGISMFVAKEDYLFGGKLLALISRPETAIRDVYDLYYFAKNGWDINSELIEKTTGKTAKEYLSMSVSLIEKIKDGQVLQGLGELLDHKEKDWAKLNLKKEALFMIRNYLSAVK